MSRIYIYKKPVHMGLSFNGLTDIVQENFDRAISSGTKFLFFNRKQNYIKILFRENDGFVLLAKRLDSGSFPLAGRESITLKELSELVTDARFYTSK